MLQVCNPTIVFQIHILIILNKRTTNKANPFENMILLFHEGHILIRSIKQRLFQFEASLGLTYAR